MFIDSAVIEVSSGRGGHGKVAFRREKYIPKGGPSGGDGGNGGDVILQATPGVDTLLDFAGRHHWAAEDGGDGGAKQCHGANGEHLTIKLPPGTLVYHHETGELIVDLATPNQSFTVAKGGRGGFGNEHFKSPTNQTPRTASQGEPGTTLPIRLELKLIADVGLIGKPNAGKSTLLSVISKATPRIADYPFTTLEPQLGIAELSGARRLVVADIPGLIEGASTGAGLGIRFLRHVERTRLLVHLIEAAPLDGVAAVDTYRAIRAELAAYSEQLAQKPELVAISKADVVSDKEARRLAADLSAAIGKPVRVISAAARKGVTDLLEAAAADLGAAAAPRPTWR